MHQLFISTREEALALYLEFYPLVQFYQRGDAAPKVAEHEEIASPLGTPFPIPYTWEDAPHTYYPDYVGKFIDGRLFISEAGRAKAKRTDKELAKAAAARQFAEEHNGVFWIATEEQLRSIWYQNIQRLHTRRMGFPEYDRIRDAVLAHLPWGTYFSVKDIVDGQTGSSSKVRDSLAGVRDSFAPVELEGAIWKIIGDAAASGHLMADLVAEHVTRYSRLALQDPTRDPILPDPLPHSLQWVEAGTAQPVTQTKTLSVGQSRNAFDSSVDDESDLLLVASSELPGLPIDPAELPETVRDRYERNRGAVFDVLHGAQIRATAAKYRIGKSELSRLARRAREHGEDALIGHAVHKSTPQLRPEFAKLIRELHNSKQQLSMAAIHEHPKMKKLHDTLEKKEGRTVKFPSPRQVQLEIERYERSKKKPQSTPEDSKDQDRQTQLHPPRNRMSPYSYVLSIAGPAQVCQVDEYKWEGLIVTKDNIEVTVSVYIGLMVCVKTGAIMSHVMSPHQLIEEDYLQLVMRGIEPKANLLKRFNCVNDWNCSARPIVILHDGGKIFTSKHAREVIVDRLHIIEEKTPPYAPSVKGQVEEIWNWLNQKYVHRMPGTTKGNPAARGAYDSEAEAVKGGITFDLLEEYLVEAIVDDYMQGWDKLRRQRRYKLWNDAVEEYGAIPYLGNPNDLKLLLKRSVNRKDPDTGRYKVHPSKGINFQSYWYVNPHVTARLHGAQVTLRYSRRDITVVYVYLGHKYVGPVFNTIFDKPTSEWEARAIRKHDRLEQRVADDENRETRTGILTRASGSKRAKAREAKELERKRSMNQLEAEVSPEDVVALRAAMEESRRWQAAENPSTQPKMLNASLHYGTATTFRTTATHSHLPPAVPDDDAPPPKPLGMHPTTSEES